MFPKIHIDILTRTNHNLSNIGIQETISLNIIESSNPFYMWKVSKESKIYPGKKFSLLAAAFFVILPTHRMHFQFSNRFEIIANTENSLVDKKVEAILLFSKHCFRASRAMFYFSVFQNFSLLTFLKLLFPRRPCSFRHLETVLTSFFNKILKILL